MIVYLTVVLLISLGLYAIMFKRNLVKIVIGVGLIESGVNLLIISLGYRLGGTAPVLLNAPASVMVLPTPQALVLTSIVIGVAISALMLSFARNYFERYGTLEVGGRRLSG
ncbi:MAG: cation:proton antiporter subunit C [Candidatus Diapherotrites archaeon]|nr:cation:proton antiporter subunit C [Candidatus Diapherotrites archaeon]